MNNDRPGLELHEEAIAWPRRWTYRETVAELTESNQPCELWGGQIVMSPTPSIEHQRIVLRFARALQDWTEPRGLGIVFTGPLDMVLSPYQVTQPDVGFVSSARFDIIQSGIQGPADLVAEVISADGRTRDRLEKRALYEQHGVREYWIIDPEPRSIEVLFLEPAGYRSICRFSALDRAVSQLLPGFAVSLEALFGDLSDALCRRSDL